MTVALAILCLIAAVLVGRPRWLMVLSGTYSRAVLARLARFAPARVRGNQAERGESRHLLSLIRLLVVVDPTFDSFQQALRAIGIASQTAIVAAELAKLSGAVACGIFAAVFMRWPVFLSSPKFLGPLLVALCFVVFANSMLNRAAAGRRRRIRSELVLAMEMFGIFLEGGQTLDQAFRGFSDLCGRALPRIAVVQRALVNDLNNGISYEKAIARWASSLGVEEAKPLATLFTESLLHGTEIVSHLRQISVDLVESRILAARASIGVKSAQLSAVMVTFFLPAILAFVAAPAVVALTKAMGSMR